MKLEVLLPTAPDFRVDWSALDARFEWIRAMRGVPQDPVWHAEGDVWIHTRMVCEALVALPAWRALDRDGRLELWLAALLHDVAKPYSTRTEEGRFRSPHHSPRGAVFARELLWRAELDWRARERVCGLIRHHQLPMWALEGPSERRVSAASQRCRLDHLALLAEADIRGRVCPDAAESLESIELFVELARELDCLGQPRSFPSAHTRLLFLRGERPTADAAYDDTWGTVTLLSGPPGAGKSQWAQGSGLPIVSLDAHRRALGARHGQREGEVRQAAQEAARVHLRAKRPFVWDATNLQRERRERLIDLFRNYGARVHIRAFEAAPDTLYRQNAERPHPVPKAVIDRMLSRWERPDVCEAHEVTVHAEG